MAGLLPGAIGPYLIEAQIGTGASAVVARARHGLLGRRVALKIRYRRASSDEHRIAERFRQGAVLQCELDHPHILRVLDYVETHELQALVMEHLGGGSVEDRLRALGGPVPIADAVEIAIRAAEALGHGHDRGVVHRDVKPANLMLVDSNDPATVRVTDFGVARSMDSTRELTMAGANVGTLWYMPPEQFNNEPPTPSADIYALGATLYEMLTGTLPFVAAETAQIFRRFLDGVPPPPIRERNPAVPATLAVLVEAALMLRPEQRPPSAAAFSLMLRAVAEREVMSTDDGAVRRLLGRCDEAAVRRALERLPGEPGRAVADAVASLEGRVLGGTAIHQITPAAEGFLGIGPDDITPSSLDGPMHFDLPPVDRSTTATASFDDDDEQTMVMNLPGLRDED